MRDKRGRRGRRNRRSHGSSAPTTHGLSIPRRGFRMRAKLPAHIAGHVSRIAVTRVSQVSLSYRRSEYNVWDRLQAKMRQGFHQEDPTVCTVESQRHATGGELLDAAERIGCGRQVVSGSEQMRLLRSVIQRSIVTDSEIDG